MPINEHNCKCIYNEQDCGNDYMYLHVSMKLNHALINHVHIHVCLCAQCMHTLYLIIRVGAPKQLRL